MKGFDAQQKSYEKQREIFETARNLRINNRKIQIDEIDSKIHRLQLTRNRLIQQNLEEKEFESFDSFRQKAEEQSRNQKSKKAES